MYIEPKTQSTLVNFILRLYKAAEKARTDAGRERAYQSAMDYSKLFNLWVNC